MAIYLICFFTSSIILKISQKTKDDQKIKYMLVFIALIIPCVLAGLRDSTIGTDVEWYVKPLFECASSSKNLSNYFSLGWWNSDAWKNFYVSDYEILFSLMVYFVTKITGSLQFVLFVIELLIIIPIYMGLKKFKNIENKIWLSILVFYLMFYNISLNLMRQFISIAIIFYGISCLINDKKADIKFCISLIIAYGFHTSALLGIIVYVIYKILNYQYKSKKIIKISNYIININKLVILIIIIGGLILILNSNFIINILNALGLKYYANYIRGDVIWSSAKIIKIIPIILIFMIVRKEFMKKNKDAWFFILMFLLEAVLISQFSSVNTQSGRIGYIFQIFDLVSFPLLANSTTTKNSNIIVRIILLVYLIIFWYYTFVLSGSTETVPYLFFWNN